MNFIKKHLKKILLIFIPLISITALASLYFILEHPDEKLMTDLTDLNTLEEETESSENLENPPIPSEEFSKKSSLFPEANSSNSSRDSNDFYEQPQEDEREILRERSRERRETPDTSAPVRARPDSEFAFPLDENGESLHGKRLSDLFDEETLRNHPDLEQEYFGGGIYNEEDYESPFNNPNSPFYDDPNLPSLDEYEVDELVMDSPPTENRETINEETPLAPSPIVASGILGPPPVSPTEIETNTINQPNQNNSSSQIQSSPPTLNTSAPLQANPQNRVEEEKVDPIQKQTENAPQTLARTSIKSGPCDNLNGGEYIFIPSYEDPLLNPLNALKERLKEITPLPPNGFCLMKYEAKNLNSSPSSQSSLSPWTLINQAQAKAACASLGKNYRPLTHNEWMLVSLLIESNSLNWTSDMKRMITGLTNSPSSQTLDASLDCIPFENSPCLQGPRANYQRRTHHITGPIEDAILWDFSGNTKEWILWSEIQDTISSLEQMKSSTNTWTFWSKDLLPTNMMTPLNTFPQTLFSNTNADTSNLFLGKYLNTNINAAPLMGGSLTDGENAGIFTLDLSHSSDYSAEDVGFRCGYFFN